MLALFEKFGVIEHIEEWQVARAARNLAAHDYETDYDAVAEHFNALHELKASLLRTARQFMTYCESQLKVAPSSSDFALEFVRITA